MSRGRLMIAAIMALFALISYYGYREVNPITGNTQHISLTREQEVALGLQSAPEMADQFGGLDPDASVQSDVQAIGSRIVARSIAGRTEYPFQFHVLRDAQTVNAFALPGGPVFITRGLLDRLENEAQLAGVLGHEAGHVLGRHSAEQIARSQLAQTLVGAAGVAGSSDRQDGRETAAMAAFVAQMAQLKYGRGDEIQADTLGVRLLSEAGYDPRAMISLMKILESAGGGGRTPEFMSSHPDPGNRAEIIRRAIERRFPDGVPRTLTVGRALAFPTANR
jgi:beta-barrel assembly-enhancing protease